MFNFFSYSSKKVTITNYDNPAMEPVKTEDPKVSVNC